MKLNLPRWLSRLGASSSPTSVSLRRLGARFQKVGGRIAIGTVVFFAFLWLTLPTDAIAWRIGHEFKQRGYIVDVADVSLSPFGGITLHDVSWTFEASRPGQIPSKFVAEEIAVDISLLRYLFGTLAIDIEGVIDEGTFEGSYVQDDERAHVEFAVKDVPLYAVPKARQALNAPMSGLFSMNVDLEVPEQKFAKAEGLLELSCTACKIGDGETLLFVPGARGLMAKGVTIPEIDLGTLSGKLVVKDGNAATEGSIATKSEDVVLDMVGSMRMRDPIGASRLEFIIKVNMTEALQQRSDPIKLMVQTAGRSTKLDPPEEGMGFKLNGTITRPRFMGIKAKTPDERTRERREQARARAERVRSQQRPAPTPPPAAVETPPPVVANPPPVNFPSNPPEMPPPAPVPPPVQPEPPPPQPAPEPPPAAPEQPGVPRHVLDDPNAGQPPPEVEPPVQEQPPEQQPAPPMQEPAAEQGAAEQGPVPNNEAPQEQ